MNKPRMNPETTRLSKALKFGASPEACQCCGVVGYKIEHWQEHDHNDEPEPIYITLCEDCSGKIIEHHPRLYRRLGQWEPAPGVMQICRDCPHRTQNKCNHTRSRANGGKGVLLVYPNPTSGFVDGPKYSGRLSIFHGPVTECDCRDETKGQEIRERVLLRHLEKDNRVSEGNLNQTFPAKPGRITAINDFCDRYGFDTLGHKDGSLSFIKRSNPPAA